MVRSLTAIWRRRGVPTPTPQLTEDGMQPPPPRPPPCETALVQVNVISD